MESKFEAEIKPVVVTGRSRSGITVLDVPEGTPQEQINDLIRKRGAVEEQGPKGRRFIIRTKVK